MASPLTLICLFVAATVQMQGRPLQQPGRPLPRFVQSFYDWYAARAVRRQDHPSSYEAMSLKSAHFGRPLLRALRLDSAAQARARGEIAGLDFDPFLNSQDPCERYEVGNTTHRGQTYWVEVHGVCNGRRSPSPDVTAELVLRGHSWVFVNFHYPSAHTDLLTVLGSLRRDRSAEARPRARPH